MKVEDVTAYELLEKKTIREVNSEGYLLKHKKTGARVVLLSNDDINKVFFIGFRTPPTDSTGVAHIIEHSVLCGSDKYPIKDPFVELIKGSLNTFLNAITYPDKTMYPVASCNDKDFQNLCDVYMDAVLHPNIYKNDLTFSQEGWHYELEKEDGELTLNGVVYSEMKGAFSSPDQVIAREITNSLFPDTMYGVESGGDPDVIPQLTYEDYLKFHSTYYHPSNSYIYFYGDMDMAEKLTWLDEEYLSKYDYLKVDSELKLQEPFADGMHEVVRTYPITDEESEENATYLTYNCVTGINLDKELFYAFPMLNYAISGAPGSPLEKALIEKGIGREVYSYYSNSVLQPYYSLTAKGANEEQKEEFLKTVREVLTKIVEEGIDEKALRAALNRLEFSYREADFGSTPKGLVYGLGIMKTWLYDDTKPFLSLEVNEIFAFLKEQVGTDYYTDLIRRYLLDNPHTSFVELKPEKGLSAKKDKELAEKLAAYKDSLSAEQRKEIIEHTKALRAYQEAEDKKEDIEKIPLLSREDIEPKIQKLINDVRALDDGTKILYHEVFTNEIGYADLMFDMSMLPADLYPYAGLLAAVMGRIDTEHYTFNELTHEVDINTGGIWTDISVYVNDKNIDEIKTVFSVGGKALFDKLPDLFALMKEEILCSKLDDTGRLREILNEIRSDMKANMIERGNSFAIRRATSYFSQAGLVRELTDGIEYFRLIEKLCDSFDEYAGEIAEKLTLTARSIFRPENVMLDYTASADGYQPVPNLLADIKQELYTDPVKKERFDVKPVKKNEGFFTAGKVQYVCRAGNYRRAGLKFTGALRILQTIMGYEYLWQNIRVKGGAYGCMSNYQGYGDSYFVSYRDPNLAGTVKVYEDAVDYLKNFEADERTMTKFIIGTISDMDTPLTPAGKGNRSSHAYFSNYGEEDLQKERDGVLKATQEDIRALADYVKAILAEGAFCVIGGEEEIRKNEKMFDHMENLAK